jgi:toxin YoeB
MPWSVWKGVVGRPTTSSRRTEVLLVWDENAWQDYLWWQAQDRKVLKRINVLLADVVRNGNEGIGKPEPLKHDFVGYWSRRLTYEHRLVYKVAGEEVRIAACRYHYC